VAELGRVVSAPAANTWAMDDVACIVMYGLPGTGVPAFALALDPQAKPLAMGVALDVMPEFRERAAAFFAFLARSEPRPLFIPHPDGQGATVAFPLGEEFGFEALQDGCLLAPLSVAPVETWVEHALMTAREAALDANANDVDDIGGLG
jgi:hypothetical protein